jgi:hypothetical protein
MDMAIKYVAELTHVREVSLLGTADLAYWEERLKPEGLAPAKCEGRAQVLIIGAEGRFMGLRFRELSFSVLVSGHGEDAAYLVRAFNSRAFFTLCERVFYSTPYCGGDVRLGPAEAPSIELRLGSAVAFRAEIQAGPGKREGSQTDDDGWQGPVFLPGNARVFFARIVGQTHTYPFLAEVDRVKIEPACESGGILQALLDSGFTGWQWAVRADATHAKSRTYLRTKAPLPLASPPLTPAEMSSNSP